MTSRSWFASFALLALGASGCMVVSSVPPPTGHLPPPAPVLPAAVVPAAVPEGVSDRPAGPGVDVRRAKTPRSEAGSRAGAEPKSAPGSEPKPESKSESRSESGSHGKPRTKRTVRHAGPAAKAGGKGKTRGQAKARGRAALKGGAKAKGKARAKGERRVRPTAKALPHPKRRPQHRPKVRPAPKPRNQPSYDMRALCAAARGRVDPAIAAMCPRVGSWTPPTRGGGR
ncbi:hypothetical protein ACWCQL_26640 [Streptomyces sp. NPDC002073]